MTDQHSDRGTIEDLNTSFTTLVAGECEVSVPINPPSSCWCQGIEIHRSVEALLPKNRGWQKKYIIVHILTKS